MVNGLNDTEDLGKGSRLSESGRIFFRLGLIGF